MAQLSRPYQIALGAIVVLALVWAVLLRGHSSSPESTASTPSTTASQAPAKAASAAKAPSSSASSESSANALGEREAKEAATPTPVYKGSAPGVEGLTRAISKAHEAVGTSQRYDQKIENKSAQASNEAPTSAAAAATPSTAPSSSVASKTSPATTTKQPSSTKNSKPSSSSDPTGADSTQALRATSAVESELKAGKTVLILFWNPGASDDVAVRSQVKVAQANLKNAVAVHYALAKEVSNFGSITRDIPINQTPTLLIVSTNKQVTTLTGFPDAFGIEQAVAEVRH